MNRPYSCIQNCQDKPRYRYRKRKKKKFYDHTPMWKRSWVVLMVFYLSSIKFTFVYIFAAALRIQRVSDWARASVTARFVATNFIGTTICCARLTFVDIWFGNSNDLEWCWLANYSITPPMHWVPSLFDVNPPEHVSKLTHLYEPFVFTHRWFRRHGLLA